MEALQDYYIAAVPAFSRRTNLGEFLGMPRDEITRLIEGEVVY